MNNLEQQAREWVNNKWPRKLMDERLDVHGKEVAEMLAAFAQHILAQHPPTTGGKVLTDEEASRISWIPHRKAVIYSTGVNGTMAAHAGACLRYARDNGYLSPTTGKGLSVEQVMSVLPKCFEHDRLNETFFRSSLESLSPKEVGEQGNGPSVGLGYPLR